MSPLITFDRVSKRYKLNAAPYRTLREDLANLVSRLHPFRRVRQEDLWALKDVSFEVGEGEALGVIGPNGAGKSTILKLISRITHPTEGIITIRGRVGALIEVGAGIHPELTGRENVFLYGSIMGLPMSEIKQKFDSIVEFTGLARFIDMPVKRYSWGMQMRLGFSVAAHLDPNILLVDEVLAVGDLLFHAKCLDHMKRLRQSRAGIVFVSHDLGAVDALCSKVALIWQGKIAYLGPPQGAIQHYHEAVLSSLPTAEGSAEGARGTGDVIIEGVEILGPDRLPVKSGRAGEALTIQIHYFAKHRVERPDFGLKIFLEDGLELSRPNTRDHGVSPEVIHGRGIVEYVVDRLPLRPGRYRLSTFVWDSTGVICFDEHDRWYALDVLPSVNGQVAERSGIFSIPSRWRHYQLPAHHDA